jgi:hypothetical protein
MRQVMEITLNPADTAPDERPWLYEVLRDGVVEDTNTTYDCRR